MDNTLNQFMPVLAQNICSVIHFNVYDNKLCFIIPCVRNVAVHLGSEICSVIIVIAHASLMI
jgi:hypothetical protein